MSCDKEISSVVNKLNGRELKIGDSSGVALRNGGREVGIKYDGHSDWQEDAWIRERYQDSLLPRLLNERLWVYIWKEE